MFRAKKQPSARRMKRHPLVRVSVDFRTLREERQTDRFARRTRPCVYVRGGAAPCRAANRVDDARCGRWAASIGTPKQEGDRGFPLVVVFPTVQFHSSHPAPAPPEGLPGDRASLLRSIRERYVTFLGSKGAEPLLFARDRPGPALWSTPSHTLAKSGSTRGYEARALAPRTPSHVLRRPARRLMPDLYGGALVATLPDGWIDASDLRRSRQPGRACRRRHRRRPTSAPIC